MNNNNENNENKSELKAETVVPQGTSITLQMYGKGEVDAAITELKDDNRRLKRALWLARAERAMAESYSVLNDVPTSNKWVKTLNKLNAKAEEYK